MQKNNLLKKDNIIIRILEIKNDEVFFINCIKRTMPKWCNVIQFQDYQDCMIEELSTKTNIMLTSIEEMNTINKKIAHERFTLIAGILPYLTDEKERGYVINKISTQQNISKQTIRKYLCLYLAYQNISALVPRENIENKSLSPDEKNMRWALNKYFYNKNKNSLQTAYKLMLKEKYCDSQGNLFSSYPSIYQFRYFYRKNKSMQTYYISRNGLKNYQRNNRPLTGNGVHSFAPAVGVGMLDSTICDIYLINEEGNLIGRPILTACIDAYSGLCCGYTLTWEGGVYSIRSLMMNIVCNKVDWCNKFGIHIKAEEWDCKNALLGVLVTDMGSEYKSVNFEQITELGITIINLPSYRPELKGSIEKFFDLIQSYFKPHLKGKGVIERDFQERGAHDYRKDACLTLTDFEKIIINCIIYYNSKRIVENFPYTDDMIWANIKPYANCIWNWNKKQSGANLIPVNNKQLIFNLLPRTIGKFSRFGLKVNKLRYHCEGYTEQYLNGGETTVAYNPDDVSFVWLIDKGNYIKFDLIESRFANKSFDDTSLLIENQKQLIRKEKEDSLQAQLHLINHIKTISNNNVHNKSAQITSIRNSRRKEREKNHINRVVY